jgi:hypothetical protein
MAGSDMSVRRSSFGITSVGLVGMQLDIKSVEKDIEIFTYMESIVL